VDEPGSPKEDMVMHRSEGGGFDGTGLGIRSHGWLDLLPLLSGLTEM
jgi:hypothetical protein